MLSRSALKTRFSIFANRVHPLVIYVISVFVAYFDFSHFIYGNHLLNARVYVVYGIVGAIALAGLRLSYAQATLSYRILLRSVIAFAIFYVLTSHIRVTEELLQSSLLAEFELNYLWLIAAGAGAIGFFRPSLGLIPLLYIHWQKQQLMSVLEMPIEWMDYFTLIETGTFLILGYLLFALYRRFGIALHRTARNAQALSSKVADGPNEKSPHPIDLIVLLAVALHFGNYFYAGLIKAMLGDSPLDWVLHNRTELLVLASWNSAVLPVSFKHELSGFTYELISNVRVVTNLITIIIQLFAALAIVRIRWAIFVTLSYDVLHLVIFLTTGIFFWKFILLNLAIVAALSALTFRNVSPMLQAALSSAVICSPLVFQIMPSFAWLDTPEVNDVRLYAVTEDGTEYRVPSNFFLGASVNVAQNRFVWPETGSFPTQTWGTTRDTSVAKAAQRCGSISPEDGRAYVPFILSRMQIERFVRRTHIQILDMVNSNGYVDYDLFPHHIFSMPWYFGAFKKLDKRKIVSYRYQRQAVCLGYDGGHLTRRIVSSATFDIPL